MRNSSNKAKDNPRTQAKPEITPAKPKTASAKLRLVQYVVARWLRNKPELETNEVLKRHLL